MFRFKQFSVDQRGCAMKINTDGVLLGAIIGADKPGTILDIGTGTGVIALMLAQRFVSAKIDAVEIDGAAAQTASANFNASKFANRLTVHALNIDDYFELCAAKKYDIIVSNPPFYTGSLKSPEIKKTLAKHADIDFFERLLTGISGHLNRDGCCWLILPVTLAAKIVELTARHLLFLQKVIRVKSYPWSVPHRHILCFGWQKVDSDDTEFTIYHEKGIYADVYKELLKPYFLEF